jgi:hypothetical protein
LSGSVNKSNVGRIAERIVSNELEYRGFRVSDLNKEGTSANADLIAAKNGCTWQIQIKGATWDGWWFGYGYCTDEIIAGREKMFNRAKNHFYTAQIVVMVCVKSPRDYRCLVVPADIAEKAAQVNLDANFRGLKRGGGRYKPGKVWVSLELGCRSKDESRRALCEQEHQILNPHLDDWECLEGLASAEPAKSA